MPYLTGSRFRAGERDGGVCMGSVCARGLHGVGVRFRGNVAVRRDGQGAMRPAYFWKRRALLGWGWLSWLFGC